MLALIYQVAAARSGKLAKVVILVMTEIAVEGLHILYFGHFPMQVCIVYSSCPSDLMIFVGILHCTGLYLLHYN
jgi:hypothetical protein